MVDLVGVLTLIVLAAKKRIVVKGLILQNFNTLTTSSVVLRLLSDSKELADLVLEIISRNQSKNQKEGAISIYLLHCDRHHHSTEKKMKNTIR